MALSKLPLPLPSGKGGASTTRHGSALTLKGAVLARLVEWTASAVRPQWEGLGAGGGGEGRSPRKVGLDH